MSRDPVIGPPEEIVKGSFRRLIRLNTSTAMICVVGLSLVVAGLCPLFNISLPLSSVYILSFSIAGLLLTLADVINTFQGAVIKRRFLSNFFDGVADIFTVMPIGVIILLPLVIPSSERFNSISNYVSIVSIGLVILSLAFRESISGNFDDMMRKLLRDRNNSANKAE